jgi:hypothetical protein
MNWQADLEYVSKILKYIGTGTVISMLAIALISPKTLMICTTDMTYLEMWGKVLEFFALSLLTGALMWWGK